MGGGIEDFEGVPIIHLRESPLYGWNGVLKRGLDLVVGGVALVVLSPVLLVVASAVKLTSPGPTLLRQERMGLDGRAFSMLKFRTTRARAAAETGPGAATPPHARRTRARRGLRPA